GESPFCMTFAFFYRASLGGPDERREQKFATLVGDHFGMSPTNILLTLDKQNRELHPRSLQSSLFAPSNLDSSAWIDPRFPAERSNRLPKTSCPMRKNSHDHLTMTSRIRLD
ncbi:hypothetical protein P4519_14070, partial [Geobacillus stearothermophilus]|nr:hypothetical protein [Geobacillus stearothermophilus]MED3776205.1 hypothetical protein [Geobacillus stearothermophilus]